MSLTLSTIRFRLLLLLIAATGCCAVVGAAEPTVLEQTLLQATDLRHENPIEALSVLDAELNRPGADYEPDQQIELLDLAALITREQGLFERAMEYADRMIRLGEQSNDAALQGRAMHMRGTLLAEQGNISLAIEDFHAARRLLETTSDITSLTLAVNAIGLGHSLLGNPERAREYYQQALTLAQQSGNERLEVTILSNLALIASELEGPLAGIELHRQALALARERELTPQATNQLANLCSQYVIAGMLDQAEPACNEALPMAEALGHMRMLAGTQMTFGDLRFEQGLLDEALEYYQRAVSTINGSLPFVKMELLEKLINLHEQRGNPAQALSYMRELTELREQTLNQERNQAIEELEVRYQVEQQAQEVDLLRLETELQAAEIRKRESILYVAAVALILVLLFVLMTWRSYRIKTRLQRDLAIRNSELKQAVEQVSDLANRDALTGLFNRRAFHQIAELEYSRSKASQTPISIVIADIDHFKSINDQYGHPVGDRVLKEIADRLKANLRSADMTCRWGGEEFLMLMPETSAQTANIIVQRVRKSLAEQPIRIESEDFPVSLTFGIAEVQTDIQDAIQAADDAMYQGKRTGPNRIVISNLVELVAGHSG